jgi:hypothetical protein
MRGTLRLLPADTRLAALARDCAQMRAMFIAAPREFELVIACLAEAEHTLNASGAKTGISSKLTRKCQQAPSKKHQ